MVATRTGQHSRQQSLGDMAGVTASRKTGGGNRANEQPQQERALKRTKGGGRSGKKAAAAAEARKSTEREQDMAADDSRAIAAAVDTGESPQKKLKRDTKQAGLKAGGKPSSGAGSSSHGGSDGGAQDVRLDKSDHGDAKPAGAKRGAAGGGKGAETQAAKEEARQHPGKVVKINRAPVLTLWVKKVAQREGYDEDAALTFGKAVSGMLAQSKGRRLGIFEEKEKEQQEPGRPKADRAEVFGMKVKVSHDGEAVRATEAGDKAMDQEKVRGYLNRAFGDDLGEVEAALEELAAAYGSDEIGNNAYRLYENFRPTVSDGTSGWGAKADLDLGLIRALAHQHQHSS